MLFKWFRVSQQFFLSSPQAVISTSVHILSSHIAVSSWKTYSVLLKTCPPFPKYLPFSLKVLALCTATLLCYLYITDLHISLANQSGFKVHLSLPRFTSMYGYSHKVGVTVSLFWNDLTCGLNDWT